MGFPRPPGGRRLRHGPTPARIPTLRGHDQLLAFSCKGRGVCPSCNARRIAEVAGHLTDEVIPHLPIRQWVLSVPKRLRPFLHQTPEVASGLLGIFLRGLRSELRDASPGAPDAVRDAQLGAISFPQRFGSSLNPHDARAVQLRVLRWFVRRGLLEAPTRPRGAGCGGAECGYKAGNRRQPQS